MKQKKFLIILALLCTIVQGAWAEATLTTDTSGNYTIGSTGDWDKFCSDVSGGESYSGKTVVLTQDISVTTKCGTVSGSSQQNAFSGTFDGGGHTITADITDTGNQGTALFCYINGATIKNLNVGGIISGTQHAAAIVGLSKGTCSIQNCKATATIGGGTHIGGIVGHALDSNISLSGCVFSGTLTGGGTAKGALVGWGDSGNRTLTNCLYVMADGQDTDGLDLVKGSGSVTVSNCYKTTDAGTYGTQVFTAATAGEVSRRLTLQDGNTYYALCTVGGVKDKYLYTGSAITIVPTVTYDGEALTKGTDFTVSTSPDPVQALGDYTLTVAGQGDYTGSKTFSFTVADKVPVTSETTTLEDFVYIVNEDVTISERIQISGNVTLILGADATLTAPKGIELSEGNSLTIEGPGALTIDNCDNWKSGIGAVRVGTLVINGGTINVKGGYSSAAIGGSFYDDTSGTNITTAGGSITINGGVVNATGGTSGAGIGGGNRGPCGDIVINGGQVAAVGGSGAAGIGPGQIDNPEYSIVGSKTDSGHLTLGWTKTTDFVRTNGFKEYYGKTLLSITLPTDRAFVFDGTETVVTAGNIAEGKLVPYQYNDTYALDDDHAYTPEAPLWAATATYTKTVSDDQKGKYMSWLVPFDYTITDADLDKFDFWKIDMIAHSPDPAEEATDKIWVIIKKMSSGDMLLANMPYFYKAKEAVTGHVFTSTGVMLKAKTADVIAKTATLEEVYNFYGSYAPTTASSSDPFYYVNDEGTISYGTSITLPALRWFIRVQNKYDDGSTPQAAPARQMIIFDGESDVTGIQEVNEVSGVNEVNDNGWYTLDGRRLVGKPAKSGIYIKNGKKVVIK